MKNSIRALTLMLLSVLCVVGFCAAIVAPRSLEQRVLERTAQPIEWELRQLYEQQLALEEEEAEVTYFNAVAYDGQTACVNAKYQLPQFSYEWRPTPDEPLPPTRVWQREEFRAVIFQKQNGVWMIESIHFTGCSICNSGSYNFVDAFDFCPIAEDPFG
jgi:hypothetical protein